MTIAAQFKDKLSPKAFKVLEQVLVDLKSGIPIENDRIYQKSDNYAIIWNLTGGRYELSLRIYKEIFDVITT